MATAAHSQIKRFGFGRIIEHQLNALVFAMLVITGLSQRFHEYKVRTGSLRPLGALTPCGSSTGTRGSSLPR